MKTATMHQAKTNLSKYAAAAERGEKVMIGRRGKPEFRLSYEPQSQTKPKRQFGILKGKISKKSLNYAKHSDPEWQKVVEHMYNKPLL